MGSKSNVMVLADSLHHEESQYQFRMVLVFYILDLIMKSVHRRRYARRDKNYWSEQGIWNLI